MIIKLEKIFAIIVAQQIGVANACSHVETRDIHGVDATALINQSIAALGGREALSGLHGVTYEYSTFHANTLMQNYKLLNTDRYMVSAGSQNISFSFTEDNEFLHRIDRSLRHSDYFYFAQPQIPSESFSLVLKSGKDGYGCYVEGNNDVFLPPDETTGYVDSAMTEYLLSEALVMSPRLLLEMQRHKTSVAAVVLNGIQYHAARDHDLNILVTFDPKTHLPHTVRSYEDHAIFGLISKDLRVFDYKEQGGIKFPQRLMTIYNGTAILEDTTISAIHTNPKFPSGYFDGLQPDQTNTKPSPAAAVKGYSHAEIREYWDSTLWGGLYSGTYENISATQLAKDLPGVHHIEVTDSPILQQLVLEFEDSVIVYEAPPHQTDLVIKWVNETLQKPITHYWPTHHHHDHNYDAKKFADIGAKLIVPEVAATYWEQIPNAQLITFSDQKPYIHADSHMQARFIWHPDAIHAVDWTYSIITTKCPTKNNTMLAYVADAWSTSVSFDDELAMNWLDQARTDGMSRDTLVVPAHGGPSSVHVLLDAMGYDYPPLNSADFHNGGSICVK